MTPQPPGAKPAVACPETPSSPQIRPLSTPSEAYLLALRISAIVREHMPKLWIGAAERIIESEPSFPRNIWKEMGFRRALKMTALMVLHPYRNARVSGESAKRALLGRLRLDLEREDWKAPPNEAGWEAEIYRECEARLAHVQRMLDARSKLAYERVMREIQPPALYPVRTQQAEPAGGTTLSDLIDQAKERL